MARGSAEPRGYVHNFKKKLHADTSPLMDRHGLRKTNVFIRKTNVFIRCFERKTSVLIRKTSVLIRKTMVLRRKTNVLIRKTNSKFSCVLLSDLRR